MGISDARRPNSTGQTDNTDPQNDLFAQLSHPQRRQILATLVAADADETVTCEEFVDASPTRRQSWIELHHVHLPKLAYSGYVDWDPDRETVARGPEFDAIAPTIALLTAHRERLPGSWS